MYFNIVHLAADNPVPIMREMTVLTVHTNAQEYNNTLTDGEVLLPRDKHYLCIFLTPDS